MSFDIKEAQAKVAAATTIEEVKQAFTSVASLADEIAKESARLVAEREAEKNRIAEVEKARDESIAASKDLAAKLQQVEAKLAEMQAAQAAAEQERKFNERMAAIDDTFELSDDERSLLVPETKDLSDESFAAWMDKHKKLMKEKTKAHIAAVKAEAEAKAKMKAEKKAAKKGKAEEDEEDEDETEEECAKRAKASEAIASALQSAASNQVEPTIDNTIANQPDLVTKMKESLESGVKIGGRTLKEINEVVAKSKKK